MQPKALDVFLQNTGVHYYEQARAASAFRGLRVDHTFLHPYAARADANRGFDDLWNELRAAEHVHDIDVLGNILQARIGFFAQDFRLLRVYGNDAVARRLQVFSNAVARPVATARKPSYLTS